MNYYKGIVLLESLNDPSVLSQIEIVNIRFKDEPTATAEQPNKWSWYSVRVPESFIEEYMHKVSGSLKKRAWYTNLWREGDYILIFPNKIFRNQSLHEYEWQEAIEYGMSIGIPLEQLVPLNVILQTE